MLFKAQLTTGKEKLEMEIKNLKTKVNDLDDAEVVSRREKTDLQKKITDLNRKLTEAELNNNKTTTSTFELDRSRLKAKLEEKESEYNKLVRQNDMNVDQLSSVRKDVSLWHCMLFCNLNVLKRFASFRTMTFVANWMTLRESARLNERCMSTTLRWRMN